MQLFVVFYVYVQIVEFMKQSNEPVTAREIVEVLYKVICHYTYVEISFVTMNRKSWHNVARVNVGEG